MREVRQRAQDARNIARNSMVLPEEDRGKERRVKKGREVGGLKSANG